MQQPEINVSSKQRVDEIDRARAQESARIATLLSRSPDTEMIGRLDLLRGDASPLGAAYAGLGEAARGANEDDLAQPTLQEIHTMAGVNKLRVKELDDQSLVYLTVPKR